MVKSLAIACLSFALMGSLSCSRAPSRAGINENGANPSPDAPKDPYKEPEKFRLSSMKATDEGAKAFDLSKPLDIAWVSSQLAVLSHDDGTNLSFDFQQNAWSSPHTSELHTEYTAMTDFRDAGFFGIKDDQFSLRLGSGKILQIKAPDGFDEKSVVGANPGFVAYRTADTISALLVKDEGVRQYNFLTAPKGLKLVYPCNLHCIVWGYDGSRISIFSESEGWKALEQIIELPAGEEVFRIAIRFRIENNPVAAEAIMVQSAKGALYAQISEKAPKSEADWTEIRKLSDRYCVACHADDGYDKERTWTDLKSAIVTRLKAEPGSSGSMPPIETKRGQEMSQGERATMLGWIEKQTQTERGEIGSGGGEDANTKISGSLKSLAEAHCTSCHFDATTNGWWKSRKGSVISQVNSGKMPKNKTISSEIKKQFEDAVNALK